MATTEVILRTKIDGLGAEADVIRVKAGYARNLLIPSGQAFEATKGNLRHLASLNKSRVQREADEIQTASKLATKIEKIRPKFTLETGQGGKAFGSVTSMDIHQRLEESKIVIDRTAIKLDKPIKKSGKTDIEIRLHPDITATLKVTVLHQEKGTGEKTGA
jgi:large subunit ribosomal protein L9